MGIRSPESEISEHNAIYNAMAAYAKALDEFRFADAESILDEDVVVEFPMFRCEGRDGFAALLESSCAPVKMMQHCLSNVVITSDVDSASFEAYCIAYSMFKDDPILKVESGAYSNRLVKHNAEWKISLLKFDVLWTQGYSEHNDPLQQS